MGAGSLAILFPGGNTTDSTSCQGWRNSTSASERNLVSVRQGAEWGMNAFQRTWPRTTAVIEWETLGAGYAALWQGCP
jgi:hypothetical protein